MFYADARFKLLVVLQGMAHGEAAVVQKCSEGTIAWRMHEARTRLSSTMNPDVARKRRPLSNELDWNAPKELNVFSAASMA